VELRFALLAEKVTVGPTSAITAEGILLDAFLVEKFPAAHPLLYLLIRLNAAISEGPGHRLEIRALDDDGKQIGGAPEMPFTMVSPAAGLPLYSTQIVRITQPRFYHEGEYTFEVRVDGLPLGSAVLGVVRARTAGAPPGGQLGAPGSLSERRALRLGRLGGWIGRLLTRLARWFDPAAG
jgi:hypothetical protein